MNYEQHDNAVALVVYNNGFGMVARGVGSEEEAETLHGELQDQGIQAAVIMPSQSCPIFVGGCD